MNQKYITRLIYYSMETSFPAEAVSTKQSQNLSTSPEVNINTPGTKRSCYYYLQGLCRFGSNCRFSHEPSGSTVGNLDKQFSGLTLDSNMKEAHRVVGELREAQAQALRNAPAPL